MLISGDCRKVELYHRIKTKTILLCTYMITQSARTRLLIVYVCVKFRLIMYVHVKFIVSVVMSSNNITEVSHANGYAFAYTFSYP